jgi:starvation-inducible DNA-binding protein
MDVGAHDITQTLDQVLGDLVALELGARRLRWNLTGPLSGAISPLLRDLERVARAAADQVAQRAGALGHASDARPVALAGDVRQAEVAAGTIAAGPALDVVGLMVEAAISQLHRAIDVVAEDPVSQSLFIRVAGVLEHHAWLLRRSRA